MNSMWLVVLGATLFAVFFAVAKGGKVAGEDARRLVDGGAVLLDVRTKGEFERGHLPGAVNIPLQELSGRLDSVPKSGAGVVVYCASGIRSARARRVLMHAGHVEVHDLGAMSRW